jgi:hypothetical protein
VQELNESLLALDQALRPPRGKPRMPIDRYWAAVEEVEEERDALMRRMATSREASLLAETLSLGREVSEAWQTRPLERLGAPCCVGDPITLLVGALQCEP